MHRFRPLYRFNHLGSPIWGTSETHDYSVIYIPYIFPYLFHLSIFIRFLLYFVIGTALSLIHSDKSDAITLSLFFSNACTIFHRKLSCLLRCLYKILIVCVVSFHSVYFVLIAIFIRSCIRTLSIWKYFWLMREKRFWWYVASYALQWILWGE